MFRPHQIEVATLALDTDTGIVFTPVRDLTDDTDTEQQLQNLNSTVLKNPNPDAPAGTQTSGGAPSVYLSVSATESPTKNLGHTFSAVSVSFLRDSSDAAWGGTRIWFTGYHGNSSPQLMFEGEDSPISFLCETTGENVTVTAQAVGTDGTPADFDTSPTCTVLLDGVISAPPAPSITQTLVPVALGFQFAFAQLSGLAADVVQSYRVYRNSTNNSGTASLIQTIPHDPRNAGSVTIQDFPGGNVTFFYWVSAVNTSGLESSLTAAQSSSTNSGSAGQFTSNPTNLVINGNGEDGLVGSQALNWTFTSGTALDVATDAAKFGFRSMKIANGGTATDSYSYQDISVSANSFYQLTGWIKTDALPTGDAGAGAFFNVDAVSGISSFTVLKKVTVGADPASTEPDCGIQADGSAHDWTQVSSIFIPRGSNGTIRIYLQLGYSGGQSGNAWYAGVNLQQISQATAFGQSAVNNNGVYTGANPLTQSGTSTTISIASATIQFGDGQLTYNSGSVNPGSYGKWYVYADDPSFLGGAVTYQSTSTPSVLTAANGRLYFGQITTVSGGGGGGGGTGGGGGCPMVGTHVVPLGNFAHTSHIVPCKQWVSITLADGRSLTAVPEHPVYTDRGKTEMQDVRIGEEVITDTGMVEVTEKDEFEADSAKLFVSMPEGHLYWANGILSHNVKTLV